MEAIKNTVGGNHGFSQSDTPNMQGMTVLVTGGTYGIGYEVARAFALAKARVLLLARNGDKGEDAVRKINESSKEPLSVQFFSCDLGNLSEVKQVADVIRSAEKRLDIVVAGASVGVNKFDVTSDGIERLFAISHLGHYLLLNRLFPLIRRTAREHNTTPRVVTISSELHRTAPSSVRFVSAQEITHDSHDMAAHALYARVKLANILFTKFGLVERVINPNRDSILALAVHPGAVHTGQQDQFKEAYGPVFGSLLKQITVPFMRSPDEGSLSTLWAATSDDIIKNDWQGCYFTDPGVLGKETAQAQDQGLGKNLWILSGTLVKEKLGSDALLDWSDATA